MPYTTGRPPYGTTLARDDEEQDQNVGESQHDNRREGRVTSGAREEEEEREGGGQTGRGLQLLSSLSSTASSIASSIATTTTTSSSSSLATATTIPNRDLFNLRSRSLGMTSRDLARDVAYVRMIISNEMGNENSEDNDISILRQSRMIMNNLRRRIPSYLTINNMSPNNNNNNQTDEEIRMNDQVQDQEIINGEEIRIERNISIEKNNTYTCNYKEINECLAPQMCSFLYSGQIFTGLQKYDSKGQGNDVSNWKVEVQIHEYDKETGYLCGTMESTVINDLSAITFWEGEIVDNKNCTFLTKKWKATKKTDFEYWYSFEAFRLLKCVDWTSGSCSELESFPFIFMRWKEKFFVNKQYYKQDNGELTIEGFYYVCLSRQEGKIIGYYYDPHSLPFQELTLNVKRNPGSGYGFSNYSLR